MHLINYQYQFNVTVKTKFIKETVNLIPDTPYFSDQRHCNVTMVKNGESERLTLDFYY